MRLPHEVAAMSDVSCGNRAVSLSERALARTLARLPRCSPKRAGRRPGLAMTGRLGVSTVDARSDPVHITTVSTPQCAVRTHGAGRGAHAPRFRASRLFRKGIQGRKSQPAVASAALCAHVSHWAVPLPRRGNVLFSPPRAGKAVERGRGRFCRERLFPGRMRASLARRSVYILECCSAFWTRRA